MTGKLQNIISNIKDKIPAVIALGGILLFWQALACSSVIPSYMLPSPVKVANALIGDIDTILYHASITLQEAFYGLGLGIILALIMATLMDHFPTLNKAFYPIMIITQTIPTIALAPMLVLWMGFEMAPKITLVVITTFFPITVGLLDGYKSVDRDSIDMMRAMGAKEHQIFFHLKAPTALPHFFAGLKISTSYAVVGAVISEWLGGFKGLGVYMTRVKKAYSFDKMFAVIIFIVIISLILMFIVNIIGRLSMPWVAAARKGEKE